MAENKGNSEAYLREVTSRVIKLETMLGDINYGRRQIYPEPYDRHAGDLLGRLGAMEETAAACIKPDLPLRRLCPICGSEVALFLPFGITSIRPNAQCPVCKSLERHRSFWLYLEENTDLVKTDRTITLLHFAPEKILWDRFRANPNIVYYPVDLDPKFPGICNVVDITCIPYADNFFDYVCLNHVMEHIPDEKKALQEIYRVLKPGGTAFINVPLLPQMETTLENPDYNTPELRAKYYGHPEHVRLYGNDYSERLRKAGFEVREINPNKLYAPEDLVKYGISDPAVRFHQCQKKAEPVSRKTAESDVKVSIVIPVYNAQQYLRECLDSVTAQTLKEIEIICVDDNSTDFSLGILTEYAGKDPRFVVLQQKNAGGGAARNYAMARARGEFVTFLDSDDYYLDASALEAMYRGAKEHHVPVSGAFRKIHDREGSVVSHPLYRRVCTGESVKLHYADFQYDLHYHSYLYDRKMLLDGKVKFPEVRKFQDPPFFIQAMYLADTFCVVPVELYCYRMVTPPPIQWGQKQMLDVMRGLCFDLEYSRKHGLELLHWITAMRINNEYCDSICRQIAVDNYPLLCELARAGQILSSDIIRRVQNADIPAEKLDGVLDSRSRPLEELQETYILEPLKRVITGQIPAAGGSRPSRSFVGSAKHYVRRGVQCWRDYGVKYTMRRVKDKLLRG